MTGRYPLAAVLALRTRQVDGARLDLARALDALERRRAGAAGAQAAVAACAALAATAARAVAAGREPGALAARARWAARLREDLAAAGEALAAAERSAAAAEREADVRRDALAVERAGLRAIELHRDGWRAAEARRRDRLEQDAAEDVVSARRAAPWPAPRCTRS